MTQPSNNEEVSSNAGGGRLDEFGDAGSPSNFSSCAPHALELLEQEPAFSSTPFDLFQKKDTPPFELIPIDPAALDRIIRETREKLKAERCVKYQYEFLALLEWFEHLAKTLRNNKITKEEASLKIYRCFTTRWHALKQTPLNIVLENNAIR